MDAYPQDYVNHNLPLVLLSGLEASTEAPSEAAAEYPLLVEKGPTVFSDFPPVSGAVAENLRTVLLEEDASQNPWKPVAGSNGPASPPYVGLKIKSTGRVGLASLLSGNHNLSWLTISPVVPASSSQGRTPANLPTSKPVLSLPYYFLDTICSSLPNIPPNTRVSHFS